MKIGMECALSLRCLTIPEIDDILNPAANGRYFDVIHNKRFAY
jgi:hypothetical protein